MEDWLVGILKYKDSSLPKVMLGNKVDLIEDRKIGKEEADEFFAQKGLMHYETSAKSNKGIVESKNYIIDQVYQVMKKRRDEQEALMK